LVQKYKSNEIIPSELQELNAWLEEHPSNRDYFEDLTRPGRLEELMWVALNTDIEGISRIIEARLGENEYRERRKKGGLLSFLHKH